MDLFTNNCQSIIDQANHTISGLELLILFLLSTIIGLGAYLFITLKQKQKSSVNIFDELNITRMER